MSAPVRVHMVDVGDRELEERADQAHRLGEFIAGLIVGGIVFGALAAILVRLWGRA